MTAPLLAGLGAPEMLVILAVIVLMFGASKLPELARGSGRALRIFKAETKGLLDDDDEKTPEQRRLDAQQLAASDPVHPQAQPQTYPQAPPPAQAYPQAPPPAQADPQAQGHPQAQAHPDDTATPPGKP